MVEMILSIVAFLLILALARLGMNFGVFYELACTLFLFLAMMVALRYWYLLTRVLSPWFAGQNGYVEPGQFDFALSLMVLAAVVAGGRWGVGGIALGALAIAAYDRVLVDLLSQLVGIDLRPHNLAVFGGALYLTTLARARGYR